jgi:hypothetical protein
VLIIIFLLCFFVALLMCFVGVCRAFVVVHCVSLFISFVVVCHALLVVIVAFVIHSIGGHQCPPIALVGVRCCPRVVFCWSSLLPPCYVLLAFVNIPYYTLLMFVMASLLCFFGVRRHPLATLCWCSLVAS